MWRCGCGWVCMWIRFRGIDLGIVHSVVFVREPGCAHVILRFNFLTLKHMHTRTVFCTHTHTHTHTSIRTCTCTHTQHTHMHIYTHRTALIEVVPDSLSIHTVKHRSPYGASLSDHFFAKWPKGTPECVAAQRRMTESLAAYSIICYFLQVGVWVFVCWSVLHVCARDAVVSA